MATAAAAEPLEYELQQELSDVIIQGYISNLRHEFETKLSDNHNHIITLTKSRKRHLSEIAALRDELTGIVTAALEPSLKDDGEQPPVVANEAVHYIPDFSLIKHMSGEEINSFLKSEWLKFRREHESELQKKTEEIFRLKRDFAKDGAVLSLRKERELEFIKSKLLQTISKMDGIISRKDVSNCFDYNEDSELCRLKDRIVSLLDENERLRYLLADKRKEAEQLSSQVADAQSDVACHSLSEAKFSDQVERLSDELDDLKIESHLKDLLELSVLGDIFGNYENQIDDRDQEECLLQELIMEKEEQLRVMSRDRNKLKYENDQLVSIVGSTLVQHHEEFDLVNDELTIFREKVCEQELLISEFKSESNSMKSCLCEAFQQIHVCKEEICGLTETLTSMSIALEEAKEQNASLDATIREMKRTSVSCVEGHPGHEGHLEFDLVSMEKLSNAYSDFESRFAQSMKQNEIRLTSIISQFNPLVQQVGVLKKKEFWYKQIVEIKCSNLRKAEAEVDILGDEVDTLLSVLGKIYIALDHYSPVLKHYPGVTEILSLVQKVLKGENV